MHQDYLGYLQKVLDLAMHTAEAASAEGNHKIVLQSVREVTRIITLMTKITPNPEQKEKAATKSGPPPVASVPDQEADLLQALIPNLGQLPATESIVEKFKREFDNRLFQKRERFGKNRRQAIENKKQQDIAGEKIAANHSPPGALRP